MFGYRKRAREAAERGVQLAPDFERVHLVFGFAALTEFRTKMARESFPTRNRARIRRIRSPASAWDWRLSATAPYTKVDVSLRWPSGSTSSNSLLRSYLGKAYFEEKRDPLDARQFAIAKELDPLDPTPYLYDAIRLQSVNRPVEAMLNMEKSIELNDNRAVYRSRAAPRFGPRHARRQPGADLQRPRLRAAGPKPGLRVPRYVAPDNSSAHRFLSDAYIGVPRREIARVSELLQAQMLQDININPVQPSLAETNLSLVDARRTLHSGLNEYTPLFERNDVQFVGAGLEETRTRMAFEGIASALYDRFSMSVGSFHYETDGWRPNNGFEHISEFLYAGCGDPGLELAGRVAAPRIRAGRSGFQL